MGVSSRLLVKHFSLLVVHVHAIISYLRTRGVLLPFVAILKFSIFNLSFSIMSLSGLDWFNYVCIISLHHGRFSPLGIAQPLVLDCYFIRPFFWLSILCHRSPSSFCSWQRRRRRRRLSTVHSTVVTRRARAWSVLRHALAYGSETCFTHTVHVFLESEKV